MMKTMKDSTSGQEGQQCSYSRRKVEKQTKLRFDDSFTERPKENGFENQKLVDSFVQEIIEKATTEYIRQRDDINVNNEERSREPVKEHAVRPKDHGNGRVAHEQSSKKANKEKQKRRHHHYKYSDPVDEKEISEYEQPEEESLLQMNPNFGNMRKEKKNSTSRSRFYSRTVASFRRILSCCFGKT